MFSKEGREGIKKEQKDLSNNTKAAFGMFGVAVGATATGLMDNENTINGNSALKKAKDNLIQARNNVVTGVDKSQANLNAHIDAITDGDLTNVSQNQDILNELNAQLTQGTHADGSSVYLTQGTVNDQGQEVKGQANTTKGHTYLNISHIDTTLETLNHEIAHHNGQGETSATAMGKISDFAYNIGTSLNKEDINTHRQGITPTTQTLQNLSTDEQLAYHTHNQALLDENKGQLEGEKESGDGMYNMGGVTQGVGKTRQKECRQAGVSPNDCSAYILARSGDRAQNIASILLPTTKEEVAFTVATAGGGYVLKVAGKAGVKVIRYFKSKKELDEAVAKAKRVSRTDTRAGHEPDNDLLSNPVSGRREYYNFNLMSKTEAEEIAAKISVRSPIKVPHNATTKIEQKAAGYAQIKYTWVKDGVKYESRWHTRTPGAPANQTNSWVVTRKIQGSRTQKAGDTEYLLSNGQWVSESKWNNALKLRKQGKETRDSRDILDRGHIKDVE